MFTGIIQSIGKVIKYDGRKLWINAPFRNVRLGESLSIDGVCLTVAARKGRQLSFDVGKETQRITTLGAAAVGSCVNLERALRVGDRLGGHWVSGHVEATGKILKIEKARQSSWFTFRAPKAIRRFMRAKGSIAIDGISLTIAAVRGEEVKIMVIPHTLSHTTLSDKKVGEHVNMEADLLAKYALR
jgi:riboflavin synthase alpha subunit